MVMRNQDGGNETQHWGDDLPPRVRDRFHQPLTHEEETPAESTEQQPLPPVSRGELLLDLSRLGLLFVIVALGNILFLIVALSFLHS